MEINHIEHIVVVFLPYIRRKTPQCICSPFIASDIQYTVSGLVFNKSICLAGDGREINAGVGERKSNYLHSRRFQLFLAVFCPEIWIDDIKVGYFDAFTTLSHIHCPVDSQVGLARTIVAQKEGQSLHALRPRG